MAQLIADRRDIEFVLHELLNVEELSQHEKFAEFNKKTVDMVVSEARNLAVKEMIPTWKEGDEQGANLMREKSAFQSHSKGCFNCSLKANGWP
jgi:hypothetical protein